MWCQNACWWFWMSTNGIEATLVWKCKFCWLFSISFQLATFKCDDLNARNKRNIASASKWVCPIIRHFDHEWSWWLTGLPLHRCFKQKRFGVNTSWLKFVNMFNHQYDGDTGLQIDECSWPTWGAAACGWGSWNSGACGEGIGELHRLRWQLRQGWSWVIPIRLNGIRSISNQEFLPNWRSYSDGWSKRPQQWAW